MTRIVLAIFTAAALTMGTTEAHANNSSSSHFNVQKRRDIIVRQLSPIAFGTFSSSNIGGTTTIDANTGARSLSGTISVLSEGDYGQAEFTITGQAGEEILVSPPVSTILGKAGNGGDLIITNFKVNPGEILTLDREGNAKIKIGATLKVPGTVLPGGYNGFFNVNVRYLH